MPKVYTDPPTGSPNIPDWEVDVNSPLEATNQSSVTHQVGADYDEVMVVPHRNNYGYNEMVLNGVTTSDYYFQNASGTETTSAQKVPLNANTSKMQKINIFKNGANDEVGFSIQWGIFLSGVTVFGKVVNQTGELDTFTLSDSNSNNRSSAFTVFGRFL